MAALALASLFASMAGNALERGDSRRERLAAERDRAEQSRRDSVHNLTSLVGGGEPKRYTEQKPIPVVSSNLLPNFQQLMAVDASNARDKSLSINQSSADVERQYRDALTNQANASAELTRAKIKDPAAYRTPSIYDLLLSGQLGQLGGLGGGQPQTPSSAPSFGGINPVN
ncbi:hypothetical protein HOD41_06015 [bacterium]|nr:hypothetical protein [bacterium]